MSNASRREPISSNSSGSADPPSLDNFYDEFYSITMDEENNVREKGKEIDRGGIIRGTAVKLY